jgi:hypothetical protein
LEWFLNDKFPSSNKRLNHQIWQSFERQTERQTDKLGDRDEHKDRETTNRQTDKETYSMEAGTDKQSNCATVCYTDRQKTRHTEKETTETGTDR